MSISAQRDSITRARGQVSQSSLDKGLDDINICKWLLPHISLTPVWPVEGGGGVKRVCAIEIIKEQAAISNLKEEGDQYRLEAGGWLDDNLFSQV